MASSRAARLMSTFALPFRRRSSILHRQLGDKRHDNAGRALDLVRVEQGEAIRPHVDEVFLEREPIVLGVGPDVGEGGLTVDETWEIGRLAVSASAPLRLGVDNFLRPRIGGDREPVPVGQLPSPFLLRIHALGRQRPRIESGGGRDLVADLDP